MLLGQGGTDVGQFSLGVRLAHELEDGKRFVNAVARS
jgi:hypothetical protein